MAEVHRERADLDGYIHRNARDGAPVEALIQYISRFGGYAAFTATLALIGWLVLR